MDAVIPYYPKLKAIFTNYPSEIDSENSGRRDTPTDARRSGGEPLRTQRPNRPAARMRPPFRLRDRLTAGFERPRRKTNPSSIFFLGPTPAPRNRRIVAGGGGFLRIEG